MITPKFKLIFTVVCLSLCSTASAQNLTVYKANKDVEQLTADLLYVIEDQGLIFFETIAHDQIAKERGVKIPPTNSIRFENPALSTQLIACQQTTVLDLPLEILVWQEYEDVYIGFMDPKLMKKRFVITGCDETIVALSRLMLKITNDAIRRKPNERQAQRSPEE